MAKRVLFLLALLMAQFYLLNIPQSRYAQASFSLNLAFHCVRIALCLKHLNMTNSHLDIASPFHCPGTGGCAKS